MFAMYIRVSLFLLIICSVSLIVSCKQEDENPIDVGYNYFPDNPGHMVLYNVDSTYWDDFTHTKRFSHCLIKELVESTYLDNQNRPTQRIERYRQHDTLPFYLKDVWASTLTASTAEKVEENLTYIKLIIPVVHGQSWNGNALNILGEQDYEFDNVNEPYTVDGVTYDSTVTVIQNIDSNLIFVKKQFEVYAKNVGLIYRRYRDIQKYPNPLHDSIVSGVDYSYKIISFSN